MKLNISYNGQTISVADGKSITLKCKDLKARGNITVEAVSDTPQIITFTINSITYQAEEGMTWAEWVSNPTYNTDGFKIIGGTIKLADTDRDYILDPSTAMSVGITDKIIANCSYDYSSHSGGSGN